MRAIAIVLGLTLAAVPVSTAGAQALGTFSWQVEPYCNIVTFTITPDGPAFRLTGSDDQCGAGNVPAAGVVTPNPDGTFTLAFYLITPDGNAGHTTALLAPGTYSGPWKDDGGLTGTVRFGPAGPGGGTPRPVVELQRRVIGTCPPGEFVQKVREDGSVECGAATGTGGGDITAVAAGTGLTGGGTTGDVTLAIAPGGVGELEIADGAVGAADVDPTAVQRRVVGTCAAGEFVRFVHQDGTVTCGAATGTGGGDITGVAAGTGLIGGGTTGDVTLAIAPGGVGALEIADGAVGATQIADGSITAADVNTSQIQRRVLATCTAGTYFAGIDAAGTPTCDDGASGNSVALGYTALAANTGVFNTGIGQAALAANTTGLQNTAVGADALLTNTTGTHNSALGSQALRANSTGPYNVAVGWRALVSNTSGFNNTAIGFDAMNGNTTGGYNTAVGSGALTVNTIGSYNIAVGRQALFHNTTGDGNTAVGDAALYGNTIASDNTAVGSAALIANTMGTGNVAVGAEALYRNQTGSSGTAVGAGALRSSTGSFNAALGRNAGYSITTGFENTAVGNNALPDVTTGARNIAIGSYAGGFVTTGSDNIHIGYQGTVNESNTIRIGIAQTRAFIQGIRGVTTGNANAVAVLIDSHGQLGTVSSSRRTKEDIQDMGDASSGLFRLRPVTFRYIQRYAGGSKPRDYGLIAEEVQEVYPDLVVRNPAGEVETVQYHKLVPMLLNELQRQQREIEALHSRLAEIEATRR